MWRQLSANKVKQKFAHYTPMGGRMLFYQIYHKSYTIDDKWHLKTAFISMIQFKQLQINSNVRQCFCFDISN